MVPASTHRTTNRPTDRVRVYFLGKNMTTNSTPPHLPPCFKHRPPPTSGGPVSGLGRPALHHGPEGTVRVQRKPLYIDGDLQRISTDLLPECVNVSIIRVSGPYSIYPLISRRMNYVVLLGLGVFLFSFPRKIVICFYV